MRCGRALVSFAQVDKHAVHIVGPGSIQRVISQVRLSG
jgi:hypothetical protein